MYPRRELKYLAHVRMRRIRSIDQARRESCKTVHRVTSPLRLLDWAVLEWRATRFPVSLAMVPVGLLLNKRSDPSRLKSVHRILRSALLIFAIARKVDHQIVKA